MVDFDLWPGHTISGITLLVIQYINTRNCKNDFGGPEQNMHKFMNQIRTGSISCSCIRTSWVVIRCTFVFINAFIHLSINSFM